MVEAEHGRFGSHVSASGLHPGGPGVATLSQQFAYMSDAGGGGDGGGGDGLADGGGGGKQQQKAWDTYTPEMLDYCVQDTEVTVKLYELLMRRMKDYA